MCALGRVAEARRFSVEGSATLDAQGVGSMGSPEVGCHIHVSEGERWREKGEKRGSRAIDREREKGRETENDRVKDTEDKRVE